MIITEIESNSKLIKLVDDSTIVENLNVFSVLVGNNGSGKSRVLKIICDLFLYDLLEKKRFPKNKYKILNSSVIYSEGRNKFCISHKNQHSFSEIIDLPSNDSVSERVVFMITVNNDSDINITFSKNNVNKDVLSDALLSIKYKYEQYTNNIIRLCNDNHNDDVPSYNKIIAVTTSPFDKFPIEDDFDFFGFKSDDGIKKIYSSYCYRGSRLSSSDKKSSRDISYIENKFNQLGFSFINLFLKKHNKLSEVIPVFEYLNIDGKFKLYLSIGQNFGFNFEDIKNGDALSTIKKIRFFKGKDKFNNTTELGMNNVIKKAFIETLKIYKLDYASDSYRSNYDGFGQIEVEFDIYNIENGNNLENLSILAQYDLLDLNDIQFKKNNSNQCFMLSEASSGELSTLFNTLSIAGEIEDNSLILIDEPELSLHPKWQSGFIPLLEKIFHNYENCHFILATHSPHIISSLPKLNSYVINLESDNPIPISSCNVRNRSVDFQMAKTFGYSVESNEYLIRIALALFFKVKSSKLLSEDDLLDYDFLCSINGDLNDKSQLYRVISSISELMDINYE